MRPCHFVAVLAVAGAVALAQTPLQLQLFASGLTRPLLAVSPRGDLERVFVVEQPGRIRIVKNGVLLATPFLDMTTTPGLVQYGGESGLLGLAFHPQYASNGHFYVFHSAPPHPRVQVRRYTVSVGNPDAADATSSVVLLTQPGVYGNHNGGMIAFGPDGYLYFGIGDGGSIAPLWLPDEFGHAQRGDSLLGKMLRIDVDNPQPPLPYGIPPGNPFAGPGDPRDEIWAFGFRNPWRFSFDRLNGDLYVADVGGSKEEVDCEPAGTPGGRNYGWACMSGTVCASGPGCTCNAANLTAPIHDYGTTSPAHAIIGGYVYRGSAIPDLRGTYFYADYMRVEIWSFRRNGAGITQLTNRTAELTPPSPHFLIGPTGFGEDGYGELYVCDFAGKVYKIVPATPVYAGLDAYGSGTPGCSGPHALWANNSPVVGNPTFALRCTNAPPGSIGLYGFALQPDVVGSDPLGYGITLHLDLASLLVAATSIADGAGVGSFPFPIPPTTALASAFVHVQAAWQWSPTVCVPSFSGWSTSPGLTITIQP